MWQSFNINEVARKLRTSIDRGLSKEEAENRKNKHDLKSQIHFIFIVLKYDINHMGKTIFKCLLQF